MLEKFLPTYIFEKDPRVKKDKQDENTPTKLELEVTRAKAFAELNVYLNHCGSLNKKLRFMTQLKVIEDGAFRGEQKTKMQELARLLPEIDDAGNPVVFTPEEEEKKNKSGVKSAAHKLAPMLPKASLPIHLSD